jgi:hypothetical protein
LGRSWFYFGKVIVPLEKAMFPLEKAMILLEKAMFLLGKAMFLLGKAMVLLLTDFTRRIACTSKPKPTLPG